MSAIWRELGHYRLPAARGVAALVAVIALVFIANSLKYWLPVDRVTVTDFDTFRLVGRLAWRGDAAEAYDHERYRALLCAMLGQPIRLSWNYPPPYDLIAALLAAVPRGVAYMTLLGGTAATYVLTLRRLGGADFPGILLLMTVPISICLRFGQNGLLTGTLVGLACVGLVERRTWAGVPVGLMIIKPHFALALGAYVLVGRHWRILLATLATLVLTGLLSAVLLGPGIWAAFLAGTAKTLALLDANYYPFFRMVSGYAAMRSVGVPGGPAMAFQALVAAAALAVVVVAERRLAPRTAVGIAALASLLISPYGFDYDMPVMGIGLALLHPTLARLGSPRERLAVAGLFLVAAVCGAVQQGNVHGAGQSPAGLLVILVFALAAAIVLRREAD